MNYPDNIRDFDDNPLSPFHKPILKKCYTCGESIQYEQEWTIDGEDKPPYFCNGECMELRVDK